MTGIERAAEPDPDLEPGAIRHRDLGDEITRRAGEPFSSDVRVEAR